jgi:hypothetical protein
VLQASVILVSHEDFEICALISFGTYGRAAEYDETIDAMTSGECLTSAAASGRSLTKKEPKLFHNLVFFDAFAAGGPLACFCMAFDE